MAFENNFDKNKSHAFVIFGATSGLATKKVYPTLWGLFKDKLLPNNTSFIGYAKSHLNVNKLSEKTCLQYMKVQESELDLYERFCSRNHFVSGNYDIRTDFELLNETLQKCENGSGGNRLFYLSLPPFLFKTVTENIKNVCMDQENGWNRIIIEKPFGRDTESFKELSDHLSDLFKEDQLYRIDHYLAKEMMQNLLHFRFTNTIFEATWNRDNIASVMITFKETSGTVGNGGYFNDVGIIRDVMQNYLMQILCLVAMEKPSSVHSDDIRYEKIKLLKNVQEVKLEDCVLGQYVGNTEGKGEELHGYLDDPTVPKDSVTPTFALSVLKINNDRWLGVPFIIKCGKAMNERKVEMRIQYKDVPGALFNKSDLKRNELVIRVQPNDAIYIKIMNKISRMSTDLEETELDLSYTTRYKHASVPDAYKSLLFDVFCGVQTRFVSAEELAEAWRIFTPLLNTIEEKKVEPSLYIFGSRGPEEADVMCARNNFIHYGTCKCAKS